MRNHVLGPSPLKLCHLPLDQATQTAQESNTSAVRDYFREKIHAYSSNVSMVKSKTKNVLICKFTPPETAEAPSLLLPHKYWVPGMSPSGGRVKLY